MHAPSAPAQFYRMLQVQHLVVHDVFDSVAGYARVIEHATDDDCIVSGIVMPETVAGMITAPGHLGTRQQSVKETRVQIFEDLFQVVRPALRRLDPLSPAHLPHQMGFPPDVVTGNIAPIAYRIRPLDRLAIHLGQQDMGNCPQHGFWRAFQQVRQAHQEFPIAQANGVVDVDESEELDAQLGARRARTQLAIGFLENLEKPLPHVAASLARVVPDLRIGCFHFFLCLAASSCCASSWR